MTKREFARWAAEMFETTGADAWSEPRPQRRKRKIARMKGDWGGCGRAIRQLIDYRNGKVGDER